MFPFFFVCFNSEEIDKLIDSTFQDLLEIWINIINIICKILI